MFHNLTEESGLSTCVYFLLVLKEFFKMVSKASPATSPQVVMSFPDRTHMTDNPGMSQWMRSQGCAVFVSMNGTLLPRGPMTRGNSFYKEI